MQDIDLTPFGFTPTENRAYGALLDLGPSSGYALAKSLSIARANAYQALNGLVAKGAAVATDDQPQRFRAQRPDVILARVIATESSKLDALESQVGAIGPREGSAIVLVQGRRGLTDIALRTVARAREPVTCLGPVDLVASLSPGWRHRVADDRQSILWLSGEDPGDLPVDPAGLVSEDRMRDLFGVDVFILLAEDVAVVARIAGDDVGGYWTSDSTIFAMAKASVLALTG